MYQNHLGGLSTYFENEPQEKSDTSLLKLGSVSETLGELVENKKLGSISKSTVGLGYRNYTFNKGLTILMQSQVWNKVCLHIKQNQVLYSFLEISSPRTLLSREGTKMGDE